MLVSGEVAQSRISKWLMQATPVTSETSWSERRLAIVYGGHTYLVANEQVFQCAHCGHYDPQWKASTVIAWFEEKLGIKPQEIEVTVTVATV